ncbi:hypothetical protein HPP92_025873 [Vanilla planifolia]|uniref:Uncharacterized protein n=1 Tax=Vanilla planifolia TaxID=51239 RepID=A0A835PK18_VANPL|nr:hypothetical protein HPP92_025873 [Vanilla planifolia]
MIYFFKAAPIVSQSEAPPPFPAVPARVSPASRRLHCCRLETLSLGCSFPSARIADNLPAMDASIGFSSSTWDMRLVLNAFFQELLDASTILEPTVLLVDGPCHEILLIGMVAALALALVQLAMGLMMMSMD